MRSKLSLSLGCLLFGLPLGGTVGLQVYNQKKELCGYGGQRANCVPIDGSSVADFVTSSFGASTCFLTDTTYTVQPPCAYLKHYGNGVITFATGGLYQYTDRQSSRNQYQRGEVEYQLGGGGGLGAGQSQGVSATDGATVDFFVLRQGDQSLQNSGSGGEANEGNGKRGNNGAHHDWYELRNGIYKFGYYDCSRIVQGGAVDDYQYHYFCSSGYDLYEGERGGTQAWLTLVRT
mmetsp:Transcript_41900/g.94657  ORF Transcript_41900/g.94657 Transcript_41900/m.94657 type:complete len:233 (-) Transcript_41900:706-1404(-)